MKYTAWEDPRVSCIGSGSIRKCSCCTGTYDDEAESG